MREEFKFNRFREFELFVYKEHQNENNPDTNILKTYTFKKSGEIVRVSFIDPSKKDLLRKIVDQNCDIFYNARLLMKRQTMVDSSNKSKKDSCTPTFHNKLILFLLISQK